MKPVFIIAIVAAAMIGVMVPSVFAEDREIEYYKNLENPNPSWEIEVIDENQKILKIIGIEVMAFDIDKDLNKLYSINSRSNNYVDYRGIFVTNLSLDKIEKFIPVGETNVNDVKINHITKKAYVTLYNEERILVIDIRNDTIIDVISLSEFDLKGERTPLYQIAPHSISINELTNTVYFSYFFQNSDVKTVGGIGIIDGNTDSIINAIHLDGFVGNLFVDNKLNKIFAGLIDNEETIQLLTIDSNQNKIVNKLTFDNAGGLMGFVSHNNHLYFSQFPYSEEYTGMIRVLNTDTNKILNSFETGISPWSLAVDEENERLFVSTGHLTGIQIFDLKTNILIDIIESNDLQSPIIYDVNSNTLFEGVSNGIKKITPESIQIKTVDLQTNYRQTSVPDFPSYSKSPEQYVQRYNSEITYKQWFDENFSNNSIEEIVYYKETHVAGFPDNSKSPEHYVNRYFDENSYQSWFTSQFPNESIQSVLGITNEDISKILVDMARENRKNYNDEKALELSSHAIQFNPENPEAHSGKGFALSLSGNDKESIPYFEQSIKIDQNHLGGIFGLADSYYFLENYLMAVELYERGLSIDPTDEYANSFLGLSLSAMGNKEGLQYTQKAINSDPDKVDFLFNHALALHNLEMYEEAIKEYKKVLKIQPDSVDALNNLGVIYSKIGEFKKSEKYLEDALLINPEDSMVQDNLQLIPQTPQYVEQKTNAIAELLELTYKIKMSADEGDEKNAKKYAKQLITLYENDIEPVMPDSVEKRNIANTVDEIKKELQMGEYAKPSLGGGCLIATATYGSELAPQVQQLRELRDTQLLQTESGTAFMSTFNDIYYSFSPIIADYERENPYFKEAVKLAITPMISSLSLMNNANSESEVLSIGISVIMLNLGMYLGIPAVVIVGIRK